MMMHYIVVVYETPVLYAMVAMVVVVAAAKHCSIPFNRLYDAYVFRSNPISIFSQNAGVCFSTFFIHLIHLNSPLPLCFVRWLFRF